MYRMTLRPFAFAAAIVSPRKSRLVEQLPGIFDGQGRAYPSRLWNEASTRYWACSFCAADTHLLALQPVLVTSASHAAQSVFLNGWAAGSLRVVRNPQCRNSPA